MPQPTRRRRGASDQAPREPQTLGLTEPNAGGRRYRHGTISAYSAGVCRCQDCRDALAAYRASRRAAGKDNPHTPRQVDTDGHISRDWFRRQVWLPALAEANLGFHLTPHGLRHAHASWLLAGGADLQVVKERLGHGSITTTEKYLRALPHADKAALAALDAIRDPKGQTPATGETDAELTRLRHTVEELKGIVQSMATIADRRG
jgi:Phage integrase family